MIRPIYLPSHLAPANYQAVYDALRAAIAKDVGFEVSFDTRNVEKGCTFHKLEDCIGIVEGFAIISCWTPCVLGYVPVSTAEPKLFAYRHPMRLAGNDKRRHNVAVAKAREFLECETMHCKNLLLSSQVRDLTEKLRRANGNA